MLHVRRVTETDRPLLIEAAKADPYHAAAGITGDHWLSGNALFYEDDQGPVVALKTSSVARCDIQFLTQDKTRNSNALLAGFWKYADVLIKRGNEEIIFHTESPDVARFFCKRFHFRPISAGTFSLSIR